MDKFTQAYIECALWASTDNSNEQGGEPLDRNYTAADIAPESLARILEVCTDFQAAQRTLLDATGATDEQHGYDFFLTRNRHGAGFWDRGYGALGNKLTTAAHAYGDDYWYVVSNGKIYSNG